jgi:chromate transport protein ChrA
VNRIEGLAPSEPLSPGRVDGPSLRELVSSVAFETNRTVGGGLVSIELLRRRFTARGWLDATVHGVFIAVSRFTPGTVVLAYVVMLGWRFHRWTGAVLALAVASIPASLIVFALAVTLAQIDQYPTVRALLAVGILVAGVLVLGSAWHLVRPYVTKESVFRLTVIALIAVGLVVAGATPVRVLLVAAVVSAVLPIRRATA